VQRPLGPLRSLARLFSYRELIYTFTTRNLKIKYKGSLFGFLWSLITPLLMMVVYTVVFSYIIRIRVEYPYVVFVLCGLLPWTFFASSLALAANSILENANLIKRVPFPRETIPLASVLANLVNFGISMSLLFAFLLIYRIPLGPRALLLVPLVLLHLAFTLGLALIFASLTVFFRDIQHMLEIILTVWFYATPIIYPSSLLEGTIRKVMLLNPMVSITELYRCSLLYEVPPAGTPSASFMWGYAAAWSLLVLAAGYGLFSRLEHRFVREL